MINAIKEYYGNLISESEEWLNKNCSNLTEEDVENFKQKLFKEWGRKKGSPDIKILSKVLTEVTGNKPRIYYWAVCMECGCEYDYRLPMCPKCYEEGYECRRYAVKKSDVQPPAKVIRFNKTYIPENRPNSPEYEPACYGCKNQELSYCRNFGNYNWNCPREDFEMCKCKKCCGIAKRANMAYDEKNKVEKVSDRIPLKRC